MSTLEMCWVALSGVWLYIWVRQFIGALRDQTPIPEGTPRVVRIAGVLIAGALLLAPAAAVGNLFLVPFNLASVLKTLADAFMWAGLAIGVVTILANSRAIYWIAVMVVIPIFWIYSVGMLCLVVLSTGASGLRGWSAWVVWGALSVASCLLLTPSSWRFFMSRYKAAMTPAPQLGAASPGQRVNPTAGARGAR